MKTILYTKFFNDKIEEDVNIILSPQFYWIKKIDIPLKSLKEAKKIAQNYFDLKGDYYFDAIKLDDIFFAIAIDKNLDIKIDKKYIKSIKLAQVEFYKYDAINLENNYQLKKIEDILFCFPNHTENTPFIDDVLKDIKLSKQNINFLNNIELDKTSLILLSLSFIFITFTLTLLIFSYKQEIKNLELKKENLKKYNLPLTNIQLNSILSQLKEIEFNNILLKKDLKFISKTPLHKNEKFILLETIKDGYRIKIKTNKNFNNYFKQRFNIKKFNLKNSIYEVEVTHG